MQTVDTWKRNFKIEVPLNDYQIIDFWKIFVNPNDIEIPEVKFYWHIHPKTRLPFKKGETFPLHWQFEYGLTDPNFNKKLIFINEIHPSAPIYWNWIVANKLPVHKTAEMPDNVMAMPTALLQDMCGMYLEEDEVLVFENDFVTHLQILQEAYINQRGDLLKPDYSPHIFSDMPF